MFKIEKGVPIAKSYREYGYQKWAILDTMNIGDSFQYEFEEGRKGYNRAYNRLWNAFNSRNMRCLIRKIDDNKLRVWRISKHEKRNEKLRVIGNE